MSNQSPQYGELCWNELMTTDAKRAKEFYSSLFGWEAQDHDVGSMTYTMLKKGDKEIGGLLQIPQDKQKQVPPHWLSYVSVENTEIMLKKAQTLGATVIAPVTPVGDFGQFAIIQDPTGAHIALWQSLKSTC